MRRREFLEAGASGVLMPKGSARVATSGKGGIARWKMLRPKCGALNYNRWRVEWIRGTCAFRTCTRLRGNCTLRTGASEPAD